MSHHQSKTRSKSNKPRKERHLRVVSVLREQPDLEKIARAVFAMALQMAQEEQKKQKP